MVAGGFALGRTLGCSRAEDTAQSSAYDRCVRRKRESSSEIGAELTRLRRLEQGLRAERERIRAAAAAEVHQLQVALRETSARAAHREREVQHLQGVLQRGAASGRLVRFRRGGLRVRRSSDTTGAIQRVLASFERERRQLEERAKAVAETESRHRKTEAELRAESERLGKAAEALGEQRRMSSDLRAAEKRISRLERQLRGHEETKTALAAASAELAALARVDQRRREAEAALVAAQARPAGGGGEAGREVEAQIAALLARREQELERRNSEDLERRRALLEQEAAADLDRRLDHLDAEARATLERREQELVDQMSDELLRRREELERAAAEEGQRVRADGGEVLERERSGLREEILAREVELARREETLARRGDPDLARPSPNRRRRASPAGAVLADGWAVRAGSARRAPGGGGRFQRGLATARGRPGGRAVGARVGRPELVGGSW